MITIKCYNSKSESKYKGSIEIYLDEDFISVIANWVDNKTEEGLITWEGQVFDKFFIEDVESIRGTND